MALANPEDMESVRIIDNSATSCSDRSEQVSRAVNESENLGVDVLDGLESYMEDIDDRLTVSRMVSDSVIRGMVGALEQKAADRIALKESEISRLTERLLSCNMFATENRVIECPSMCKIMGGSAGSMYRSNLDSSVKLLECDDVKDLLRHYKPEAGKQLNELKEQIHTIGQKNSIDSTNSGLELAGGFGCTSTTPLEEDTGRFTDIDRVVDCMQIMLDSFFSQVSNIVYLSKSSFSEWQQEREFQAEVEAVVTAVCFRSLWEEFQGVLRDQNPHVGIDESINLLKKRKEEFSSLRQELDGFHKLLSVHDASHRTSHGSLETGEECGNGGNSYVTDHLHRKLSGGHVFSSSPPWEANGKHEELTIAMPENIDTAKLVHLTKENLVDYFKTEMIKMKRNHESKVQEMTEEYFRLKREYLRERGSSLPSKKDKDLDELRRKIPGVISKLDEILVESDIISSLCGYVEHLNRTKERLDALLSENSHLRDMLADKMREIEHLSAKVSDDKKKISGYSLAEANFLEVIANLKNEKEEEHIKSTISEEVYQCFLRMLPTDICCISDNLCMESDSGKVVDEVSLGEAISDGGNSSDSEIENLYVESVILQELSGLLFIRALKEAKENFDILSNECIHEKILQVSLEQEVWEKGELVTFVAAENQRLKEEMLQVAASLEEKGRLAEETSDQLAREKQLFNRATRELERLRDETRQQGMLIAEISKESEAVKSEMDQALEKIEMYKEESHTLKQELDYAMEELNQKEKERKLLLISDQQKQDKLLLAEVSERAFKKQMESFMEVAYGIMKLLADLENRATVDIKTNQSRLDLLGSDLSSLTKAATLLRRRGLAYKQRFERKCLDLEKAENEVDLLGDEVDNLLSLLEKIYIALDHYSPVLKHYPGVMEILKLVRRELSGESEISTKRNNL